MELFLALATDVAAFATLGLGTLLHPRNRVTWDLTVTIF